RTRRSSRSPTSAWWGICSRCCRNWKQRPELGRASVQGCLGRYGHLKMRILLWGTYDTGKPRIRILRDGLKDAPGVELGEIHGSVWEGIEDKSQVHGMGQRLRLLARWLLSYPSLAWRLLRAPRPDLLLISYPGILDVLAALPIARLRRIPIAWDVFISLYDTVCHDRLMLSPSGLPGRLLRWVEGVALRGANIVFMD